MTDLRERLTGAVVSILSPGDPSGAEHPDAEPVVDAVLAALANWEMLITGGEIFDVVETDWQDDNGEYQTWTVFTEPAGSDEPDEEDAGDA